jgi:hypothetical protein
MTDVRADDELDDDRLPWLEAVEEDERGPSPVKLIAAIVIGLIGGGGEELIASPGEYKMPAPDPGGMQLDNRGSTQVATSEGTEQTSSINPNARPEAPVNQPQQPAAPPPAQPQGQPKAQQPGAAPAQPRPQAPAQPPQQARLSGPTIQVGAYPSAEAANGEWARLTQRYPYLRSLQHGVMTHQRGGQTFYRLRAAGGQAAAVCRRLRAAGQPCMDVND